VAQPPRESSAHFVMNTQTGANETRAICPRKLTRCEWKCNVQQPSIYLSIYLCDTQVPGEMHRAQGKSEMPHLLHDGVNYSNPFVRHVKQNMMHARKTCTTDASYTAAGAHSTLMHTTSIKYHFCIMILSSCSPYDIHGVYRLSSQL
jgi:hypothetical protein